MEIILSCMHSIGSQTSINRLTAPPSATARPAILSSRDHSIADYS